MALSHKDKLDFNSPATSPRTTQVLCSSVFLLLLIARSLSPSFVTYHAGSIRPSFKLPHAVLLIALPIWLRHWLYFDGRGKLVGLSGAAALAMRPRGTRATGSGHVERHVPLENLQRPCRPALMQTCTGLGVTCTAALRVQAYLLCTTSLPVLPGR